MSAVATRRRGGQLALGTERPRREGFDLEQRLRRERSANCSDGGRLTLEQRLDGVWEGLHAAGVADCPVDSFVATTTVCRASAGICDTAESCAGVADWPLAGCARKVPRVWSVAARRRSSWVFAMRVSMARARDVA